MKLDPGGKAFLMASSGDLLVAANAAMGELGGSAVQAVRKLWVDYAISVRDKENRKVRAARAASARVRWRRLCKLGLKNQGARLVYAGILPHTTFGAALQAPAKSDVASAQIMMGGVGLKKPLGTSCILVQAVDRPGRSAKFVYIKEAVGRWAREVWLLASASRPLDALTA